MTWRRAATVAPGIGVSLLPKLICPLCWPHTPAFFQPSD